jgi:hypothetical protein
MYLKTLLKTAICPFKDPINTLKTLLKTPKDPLKAPLNTSKDPSKDPSKCQSGTEFLSEIA